MNAVLLTSLEAESADVDVTALVRRLLAEVDQLRAEVANLRRENLALRQQAGYWQSRHADAVRRLTALEQDNEQLRGENRKLHAERFGRRSEKQSASDRSQDLEDPAHAQPPRPHGRQPGQPAPPRRDYSHLPTREQFLDLPSPPPNGQKLFLQRAKEAVRTEHGFGGCLQTNSWAQNGNY